MVREVLKKKWSFYGPADKWRYRLILILQSAFCVFLDGHLTLGYDYTCSETDFTQAKNHLHQLLESSFTAAALSQNGRIVVSIGVKS